MSEGVPSRGRDDVGMVDPVAGVERQLERSSVRSQSLFNRTFERLSELERMLLGLIDVLLQRGVVEGNELEQQVRAIGEQLDARGERADHSVIIRSDSAEQAAMPEVVVDCAARMPVCRAVCCKLSVKLDGEEIEGGRLRWDLGRPYLLRKEVDGRCTHQDRGTGFCGVYDDRPRPCRQYSCASDGRIWSDFDNMVLNEEWLSAHFGPDEPRFIPLQPLRSQGGAPR